MSSMQPKKMAQVIIYCSDLAAELDFFTALGFKLLQVFPADNPRMMLLGAEGLTLRLEKSDLTNKLTLQLPAMIQAATLASDKNGSLVSPHGVVVQFQAVIEPSVSIPESVAFAVNRFDASSSWITGRAGMLYRDLITNRLGGSVIASNIMIPVGGPVPDHVHYHSIQFQLICCVKGWVKVVYEDQGDPFILRAGDCVTQPPGIRHQVLESSDGLEVLEIGLPAEHMTTLDYDLILPTGHHLPNRLYGENDNNQQQFCHHQQAHAEWHVDAQATLLICKTAVESACGGLAAVHVLRTCDNLQPVQLNHHDTLRFYYLMAGEVSLKSADTTEIKLSTRDSFVLPPAVSVEFSNYSDDFQCIEFILRRP